MFFFKSSVLSLAIRLVLLPLLACFLLFKKYEDDAINRGGATVSEGNSETNEGYLFEPMVNRLVAFDGSRLHGVLPGEGLSPRISATRTTLMVAFWTSLCIQANNSDINMEYECVLDYQEGYMDRLTGQGYEQMING